jgi:hypothetical protein
MWITMIGMAYLVFRKLDRYSFLLFLLHIIVSTRDTISLVR